MAGERSTPWSDITVVIDASNVARDDALSGCGRCCWGRVELLQATWRREIDNAAVFFAVVDKSTTTRLSSHCKQAFRRAREAGGVLTVDFADPEVLALAEQSDAAVLSRDLYRDGRRDHPWVDGNRDRFFGWSSSNSGVRFVVRDMGIPSDYSKSRAEEGSELKGQGLDVRDHRVVQALAVSYRCDDEGCWRRKLSPDRYMGTPDLTRPEAPKCSTCGSPLTPLGPAERLVQLKFASRNSDALERVTLSAGQSLVIGREATPSLIERVLGEEAELISRRHAQVDWDGSALNVTDLGSKNGTKVRRWDRRAQSYEAAAPLSGAMLLAERDQAVLGDALLMSRSGRKYYLEAAESISSEAPGEPPTQRQ